MPALTKDNEHFLPSFKNKFNFYIFLPSFPSKYEIFKKLENKLNINLALFLFHKTFIFLSGGSMCSTKHGKLTHLL